jgi:hypothetical protein
MITIIMNYLQHQNMNMSSDHFEEGNLDKMENPSEDIIQNAAGKIWTSIQDLIGGKKRMVNDLLKNDTPSWG